MGEGKGEGDTMFDTHAHYDDKAFNNDRYRMIEEVHGLGVEYIINAGSDIKSSKMCIELAEKFEFIYAAVGVHPHEASKAEGNYVDALKEFSKNKKVVAMGEIGLDYHYDFSPRDIQKRVFIEQINLAKDLELPIIVHDRESHEDTLNILSQQKHNIGVLHCFSGSYEMAKDIINMGFYIGIGGPITFNNARKTIEVVEKIPIEYILCETDCPYLTPAPFRGQRNDSRYVRLVIEKIAEIKNIGYIEAEEILTSNAKRLFKI